MTHKCDQDEFQCIEMNDQLWIQEFVTEIGAMYGRTFKVKYCPICGYKIPEKMAGCFNPLDVSIPGSEVDNSISQFSHDLAKAIAQMNYNVECIKSFMSSQNLHNELFMERLERLEKESR